ncbi:alkyldihydroxyacetonephosphate synthase [Arthrobacter stackebrandtii]|uniref:Alkyldihydroxyacetonephosphate synthase n=1 Tax=Arthrobacter stackebrandtii TaxID=272161 RepID=A0ABS4YWD9_9MICC|nr:FAD-binding oxidoreductase [Arthrobacter stackebrandtii]MBP2413109.1 alkyldihydroxyacetonephosphate synthase [Arthrobacter stackebrandtii]PYH01124.1 FAD-binding oxidoreductase [Arthrobacter stackebrandtii]
MVTHITEEIPRSVWYGWGDPARAKPLGPGALDFLRRTLKLKGVAGDHPPVTMADVRVGPSALDAATLNELAAITGPDHVATDATTRILHAGGKSTPDLIRRRSGDALEAPEAVVFPAGAEEVRSILALCVERNLAVVTFGGGTSVVGGVEPVRGRFNAVITLDMRRMDRLLHVDPLARTATFEAGIRGPAIEAALAPHGLTLGHFPQSHQEASLGGYLATRSAGQASTGYGRSNDLVKQVHLETPAGPFDAGSPAPGSAAGPKLLDVVVGSEGTLGVITSATLKVVPVPQAKVYGAWSFPSFEAGAEAMRKLRQDGARGDMPHVCRLSDTDETASTFKLGGAKTAALQRYLRVRGQKRPAMALFVWEGSERAGRAGKRRSARIMRAAGGISLGPLPGKSWEHGRFSGPYLRDELLTRGVYVETLETAATWGKVASTYAAVRSAILAALGEKGAAAFVQTHISHVYSDGASLYFTFLSGLEEDGLAQNARVKAAASEAIVAAGATITHHHAVGIDHAPYMEAEIGALGIQVLAGIKGVLDPHGIMNPGKLIPAPPTNPKEAP